MKGNVFPLVRVINLKLMEYVRDAIFMTLIVVNVTKMDVKSVKMVFIQIKINANFVLQLLRIVHIAIQLNVLLVKKEKNYKIIDVLIIVVKSITLIKKIARFVVQLLIIVRDALNKSVLNVKIIIIC